VTRLVGVIESSESSADLLGPTPDVRYVFVNPDTSPPAEIFDVEAIFIWNVRSGFLREHWARFERLRWVHIASDGAERVLTPEVAASDVVLTNSRHVFDQSLAEYALGLMLSLAKGFSITFAHQTEHRWVPRDGETLSGKLLVMVGVGPIARRIAQFAKALGMVVRGVGRSPRAGDPDFGDITDATQLNELFAVADYVVMVLPSAPGTEGLVGSEAIAALRPAARLVNVGRAVTLDQEALCAALREGRIAGAALDVVSPEPLPADSPLWNIPNLIISPHMSGDHTESLQEIAALFQQNLARWQQGEPLLNVVDKRLGYVPSERP
jgi:phosphoglycerate dehydrogenase-like enzyme